MPMKNDPRDRMEELTPKQQAVIQFYTENDLKTPAKEAAKHAGCTNSYANKIRNDYREFIRARKATLGGSTGTKAATFVGDNQGGGNEDEPVPEIVADGEGVPKETIVLNHSEIFRCIRLLPNDLAGVFYTQMGPNVEPPSSSDD